MDWAISLFSFPGNYLPREVEYSTTEKKCLAIVNSLKHFEVYLIGRHFEIQTDHVALCYVP